MEKVPTSLLTRFAAPYFRGILSPMRPDYLDSDDPREELPDAPPHDDEFPEESGNGQPDWWVWEMWYRVDDNKLPG